MPLLIVIIVIIIFAVIKVIIDEKYKKLEDQALSKLKYKSFDIISYYDENIIVQSRQSLEKYNDIKFFKDHMGKLDHALKVINKKIKIANELNKFLENNEFKEHKQYKRLVKKINKVIESSKSFRIYVKYISSAGNQLGTKTISIKKQDIDKFINDPSLLMGKAEYNRYIKEKEKEALNNKKHAFYAQVNKIIDYANNNRKQLFIKGSVDKLDELILKLYDKTVDNINKIKTIDSEEWDVISSFITHIENETNLIINKNLIILKYYESSEFIKIKETCEALMSSQKEFNDYIIEKISSISKLFGTKVVRNETINEDEYQYIRPYKKIINPFTAEVSSSVFASAENSPLEYVIKHFYPNKDLYPEQIQKLHLLIEELYTLKEAKNIIENYKKEYRKYLNDVPDYILLEDEAGFYSKLGFANIDESTLVVEYKFSYTSDGGMAKRTFVVPMTEETIIELIKLLEGKLTNHSFTKEQRSLMSNKLREFIKKRDNFTCCVCGNSTRKEPNLLLEIDHIIPISKGGYTIENNLQTLCWKCNRAKGNKIIN